MANAQFIRHLQHLSMPILAVSAFNGSPELASLLSLRAAVIFVLRSSEFYANGDGDGEEMVVERDGTDAEIERLRREGRVDFLRHLRRPLTTCSRRPFGATTQPSRGVQHGSWVQNRWHDSWTLRQHEANNSPFPSYSDE